MEANQTESSMLEQKSVIKFLVAEKCKPCEVYWQICDVYREAFFSQEKMFTIRLKYEFLTTSLSRKDSPWNENILALWLRKKFQARQLVYVMLTILWDMKGLIIIDFLEKDVTPNSASYFQFLRQYFTLFIEWPLNN